MASLLNPKDQGMLVDLQRFLGFFRMRISHSFFSYTLLASLIPGLGAGQLLGQPKTTTASSLGVTVGETLQPLLENGVGDFGCVV